MTDYLHIQLPPDQIRGISSIGLAHMGCAPKQAELAQRILPLLTEEEQAVFRRGRNANVHSIPTHASRAQYQQATALEALLGWLHLSGRHDRVEQLFAVMMEEE